MSAELHLPDLPEVPVALGPEPGAPRPPQLRGRERLRQALLAYLPLLLMVALALLTWWLVRLAPRERAATPAAAVRHEPDYTLESFQIQRYDASGRPTVRIEGRKLRHYPDTDEHEIEALHLWLNGADGRQTEATARQGVVAGDNSWARLEGDVHVVSLAAGETDPLTMDGQQLLVQISQRQLRTEQPVRVRQGRSAFTASSLEFDENTRLLTLHGPLHAELQPDKGRR